jgi:multiple sugar transport system ATP-binding protein
MVFQDHSLYPHLSVADNIGFPLSHYDEAARTARIAEVAELTGLGRLLNRRPGQLSGGQRQRVALGRAIARPPTALLLDQPLSSLDAGARDDLRTDILVLARSLGVATLYVTHDHVEALSIADRVAVMRRGRIEQLGAPAQIYGDPRRLFVAAFVGSPRMNLMQAAVYVGEDRRVVLDLGPHTVDVAPDDPRARALRPYHGRRVSLGVRPDALRLRDPDAAPDAEPGGPEGLRGVVCAVERRGHDTLIRLTTGVAATPHGLSQLELPDAAGDLRQLSTTVDPRTVRDRLRRMVGTPRDRDAPIGRYAVQPSYDPAQDGARHALGDLIVQVPGTTEARPGDPVTVCLELDRVFLFDAQGERIELPPLAR